MKPKCSQGTSLSMSFFSIYDAISPPISTPLFICSTVNSLWCHHFAYLSLKYTWRTFSLTIRKATKSIVMINSIKTPRTTFASNGPAHCFIAETKIEIHKYNTLVRRIRRRIVIAGNSFEILVKIYTLVWKQLCRGDMKGPTNKVCFHVVSCMTPR